MAMILSESPYCSYISLYRHAVVNARTIRLLLSALVIRLLCGNEYLLVSPWRFITILRVKIISPLFWIKSVLLDCVFI